ncbi:beta-galactosidase family protein [Actinocorallia longicatena]|uniref:Beta-galactosidase n=1 Tax=Actinocorallia longicatena TaxID=111803 RepID=A0ABP6QNN7_9ACTN
MSEFQVTRDGLLLDGKPFRVLSGAMHYFRTLPEQWADRLGKLRAMGLNTVETYVAWNLHEPRRGEFDFTGMADLESFLDEAGRQGLHAIVRPGPYICAEWENGGVPSWVRYRHRCHDPRWLEPVDAFFDELIPRIAGRQITRGGNVIMVQVENEYGSYGDDRAYLRHLADGLRARDIEVPLFTSDGSWDLMVTGGTLPGVYATANFGSDPAAEFAAFARHRPADPAFCMEFWNGWFDHWGEEHTVRDAGEAAATLEALLATGAHVNLYMAHGGTSFGFFAGANAGGPHADGAYQPTVTSYDYDAPISEHGALTPKYWAYREVLGRYTDLPPAPAGTVRTLPPTPVALGGSLALLDCLDTLSSGTITSARPPSFEDMGQAYGLAVHRSRLPGPRAEELPLRLPGLHDRAHVIIDGEVRDVLHRDENTSTPVATGPGGAALTLIVEAMGRVNYGPVQGEDKGLTGGVLHERQQVFGWETDPVPLDDLSGLPWGRPTSSAGPSFHRGSFEVDTPLDAFLSLEGWTKGYAWVNGFLLGRYWDRGPQTALYVPYPLLTSGSNEVVILEMDAPGTGLTLRSEPRLG